jgi:hypothetical protein
MKTKHTNEKPIFLDESIQIALKHRESAFNSSLTVAGGALVLSITFIQHFIYEPNTLHLLKTAWIYLMLCIITNILARLFFLENITILSNKRKLDSSSSPILRAVASTKTIAIYGFITHLLFWTYLISFIAGLIYLLRFAWVNV